MVTLPPTIVVDGDLYTRLLVSLQISYAFEEWEGMLEPSKEQVSVNKLLSLAIQQGCLLERYEEAATSWCRQKAEKAFRKSYRKYNRKLGHSEERYVFRELYMLAVLRDIRSIVKLDF